MSDERNNSMRMTPPSFSPPVVFTDCSLPHLNGAESSFQFPEPEGLQYSIPTELVRLASPGGMDYPEGHPFHGREHVTIKHMTLKEEDILTSKVFGQKQETIDRLLRSLIVEPRVDPKTILIGDREAILIQARITAYGEKYQSRVVCPTCGASNMIAFDLLQALEDAYTRIQQKDHSKLFASGRVTQMEPGQYTLKLLRTNWEVVIRLLRGSESDELTKRQIRRQAMRNQDEDSPLAREKNITDLIELMIVSINGSTDPVRKAEALSMMPTADSIFIRDVHRELTPAIELKQEFVCKACLTPDVVPVTVGVDFFRS